MNRIRVIHLADDLAKGGVTNGLRVFEQPSIAAIASSTTMKVNPHAAIASAYSADVIITHFPPRWKCLSYLFSLRLRNPTATIVHVEHSYCREWEQIYVTRRRRFRLMLKLAFFAFDSIVTVSKAQAGWLLETGAVAAPKLRTIHPYSRDQGLDQVPVLHLSENEPLVVGSYGRFCAAKGYEALIAAFNALDHRDNIRLILGGMGPLEDNLRKLANGSDRIEFVGEVKDIAAFMQRIHVFAAPSRYETFGQVASEAREAGRPVLVSTAGGLPEQVGGAGIVVDCEHTATLLAALRTLRSLPLSAMGRTGRADVQSCITNRIAHWQMLLLSSVKSGQLHSRSLRNAKPITSSAGQPR